jgi:hypothetical protein
MRDYKGLLVWAIKVTSFLFAAFGGFLTRIAPPDQTAASYPVGIISFLVLIILLVVSALGRSAPGKNYRKRWIIVGVVCLTIALPAAFFYPALLNRYTYWYPPERPLSRHVQGSMNDLTDLANDYVRRNPSDISPAELERNLPSDQIWTKPAIAKANRLLLMTYCWLVLALATAIFSLVEANSPRAKSGRSASRAHAGH